MSSGFYGFAHLHTIFSYLVDGRTIISRLAGYVYECGITSALQDISK